jgi:hypothetical protein
MTNEELLQKLMPLKEVAAAYRRALEKKEPISMVSVGDGEMYFVAYRDISYFGKADQVWANSRYSQYLNDQSLKDEVLEGIRRSDIIGLHARWKPTVTFLEHYSIPADRVCDAIIGKGLHFSGLLYEICQNRRVFLVGNHVHFLLPVLEKYQITVAGSTPVDYFEDIPRVKAELSRADFDLAIISAGIPTLILAPWVAGALHRPALDFGGVVHVIGRTLHLVGAKRKDFPIFDPDATIDFKLMPYSEFINPPKPAKVTQAK